MLGMARSITNCSVLVFGLDLKIVCIELGDFSLLLALILVKFQSFRVQDMLDDICPDLLMGIESIEVIQSLGEASEMVVNLKLASKFRQLLQFPQKWQIFARVLDFVNVVQLNTKLLDLLTIWACCATIRVNSRS